MGCHVTDARVIGWCLLLGAWLVATPPVDAQRQDDRRSVKASPARITTVIENGGRLDWSPRNNLIAYDRRLGDGYFEIYTATPQGRAERCLTCDKSELPKKSKGNPAWHPSGEYIVFQAQSNFAGLGIIGLGKITDYFANPGAGINNDVWVMDKDGRRFWQLTKLKPRTGVLHPHFSPNGDKLLWAERIGSQGRWGEWALKLADFDVSGKEVRMSNVRTFQPGSQKRMYESHGFTPDGSKLLFSGNLERGQDEEGSDIYLFDFTTKELKNLTQSRVDWDEHAHFSPDGRTIVWMSSKDLPAPIPGKFLKTDYWLMNADGSNKRRLTYFNTQGHPEYMPSGVIAADVAWSGDGSGLLGYLITDVKKGGTIVKMDLPN
jgi:Tol biopolymer transport system component